LPISEQFRSEADAGVPIVVSMPNDPAALAITRIATLISKQPRGLSGKSLPLRVS
jgi:ATP-binding protein involved in chromosome partitioning